MFILSKNTNMQNKENKKHKSCTGSFTKKIKRNRLNFYINQSYKGENLLHLKSKNNRKLQEKKKITKS